METEKKTKIHWGRIIGWAVLIIIAGWFFLKISKTITVFGLALFIAYLLYPAVHFVSKIRIPYVKKKISWVTSILIVYIILVGLITIAGVILIPTAADQVRNILLDTPQLMDKLQITIANAQQRYENLDLPPEVQKNINQFIQSSTVKLGNAVGDMFKAIGNLLLGLMSGIFLLIIALIISVFSLSDVQGMKRKLYSLVPTDYQDDVQELMQEINTIFGNYVRGNIILIFTNGLLTYLMLFVVISILRMTSGPQNFPYFDYALVTSVVAGLLYFIPYLGCTMSVVVGFILAYLQHPTPGYVISVSLIVLLTNQSVDNMIRPKVLGDALGVSTLFIVFCAIAGSEVLGVWGLLVGIPAGVMLVSVIRFVYRRFLSYPVSEEVVPKEEHEENQDVEHNGGIILEPTLSCTKSIDIGGDFGDNDKPELVE